MFSCNNRNCWDSTFWIVVIIALVILWIQPSFKNNCGCGCNDGCGENNNCGCGCGCGCGSF